MNARLLRKKLQIDSKKLTELIEDGLPWHGELRSKQFDEYEVIHWLLLNGKAEPKEHIVTTAAELSRVIGVSKQQISVWQQREGFPGCKGYFNVEEIEEWIATSKRKVGRPRKDGNDEANGSPTIQDQLRQVRLEKELGGLIHVAEVKREFARTNSYAVVELHSLAAKIEARLPSGLPHDVLHSIREAVASTVDEACKIMAELISNGEDDEY